MAAWKVLPAQGLLNLASEMNVGLSVFFALTNYFHFDASFATNFSQPVQELFLQKPETGIGASEGGGTGVVLSYSEHSFRPTGTKNWSIGGKKCSRSFLRHQKLRKHFWIWQIQIYDLTLVSTNTLKGWMENFQQIFRKSFFSNIWQFCSLDIPMQTMICQFQSHKQILDCFQQNFNLILPKRTLKAKDFARFSHRAELLKITNTNSMCIFCGLVSHGWWLVLGRCHRQILN